MAFRGLYGCPEGNENKNSLAVFQEHDKDSEVVEGEVTKIFRAMMQNFIKDPCNKTKDIINNYITKLEKEGWSQRRIDVVISRATFGLKI